jgi:enoyl-CoA hydratase
MAHDFEAIRYDVEGPVCTITLNRPEAANAQDTRLLDELDAAFDLADADDDVRVVVLAAEGKHFSAGHDLKQILAGNDPWSAMRDTAEGKLRHEQVMYFDRCVRIRDFRKPTIAAVQGACAAAGPGAGVELLVEPWELGPRKAKEFLLCAETIEAHDAERLGLVNKVVPRADLAAAAAEMAGKVALVPPVTAQAVKDSINRMVDLQGQRESWRYHFMVHQFVSNTATALQAMETRKQGGMDAVKAEQRGDQ